MKHWEFTGETKMFFGIELKRIKCTVAYERFSAQIGELGGWVEKEDNLSGNAWVSGNAQVYGDAWDKSPLYIQGTKFSLNMVTKNKLRVGCQIFTLKGWERVYKRVAKENNAEDIIEEYLRYYKLFCDMYLTANKDGEEVPTK